MPSNFLAKLGDPLRMVLDNLVKGLPLQNTAREIMEDFTTLSSSLPVSTINILVQKMKKFPLEVHYLTFSLCFEYVKYFI